MLPRISRLGHVAIIVGDIDRAVAFYSEYLGLKVSERFDYGAARVGHGVAMQAAAFMRCTTTHHELSIFVPRREAGAAAAAGRTPGPGLHHIAFELASPEDLKALYVRMRDGGVEIVHCRVGGPGNQPRFYARDPDGNLLEFYWGIDQIGWDNVPRAFPPIEEIALLDFDFDAFVAAHERDGRAAAAGAS
ncbi:MAG: VOC family protein [Rhodobacteraceae bacterium]|nr:VOC family protein [Paracoccaceae bacterium]